MASFTPPRFAHKVPDDIRTLLNSHKDIMELWNSLTPRARNEWICWVITVKREETRVKHLQRLRDDLRQGKRRPCCWAGCPHRVKG